METHLNTEFLQRFDNHAIKSEKSIDVCPLSCEAIHLLVACPKYQRSIIDQQWEIVNQTTVAESAHENTTQTFVNNHTDRGSTNAQEDVIALFTMSNSFQLIQV